MPKDPQLTGLGDDQVLRFALRSKLLLLVLTLAAGPASAALIREPGGFAAPGSPPVLLARSRPVGRVAARVLTMRFTFEQYRHPRRALSAPDSGIAALAGAEVGRTGVELGYGLGAGLSLKARMALGSFEPGERSFTAVGSAGPRDLRQFGFEDLTLALSGATSILGDRVAARLEGGLILPSGDEQAVDDGSGRPRTPFTLGERASFGGAAVTLAVARPTAPVAMHLHAECTLVNRRDPPAGTWSAPFPDRLPLVVLGPGDFDRLDLRLAFSLSRPSAHFFMELDLPLLRHQGEVIAHREGPFTVTPGVALRLGVIEVGAQLDLPVAVNDAATAFDPHLVHPDWGLRLRFGTDLVPFDRDRDEDDVGDRSDRCPNDPEDRDGYADGDGCPDLDNDGDGILDVADSCPRLAEDLDGYADEDGCPESDNDGDGVADVLDLCPQTAEDMDGVADDDGCPELELAPELEPAPDGELAPESTP